MFIRALSHAYHCSIAPAYQDNQVLHDHVILPNYLWIDLSIHLFIDPSVGLPVNLSEYLPTEYLPACLLAIDPSAYLPTHLPIPLPSYLAICQSSHLSKVLLSHYSMGGFRLSGYPLIPPCIDAFIHLSIHPVCLYVCVYKQTDVHIHMLFCLHIRSSLAPQDQQAHPSQTKTLQTSSIGPLLCL